MQPITLNTLFNRNEIKNLKDTQKFLVFFIFHLIALFVLLFVNAYIGYSKNQTERELKELKILNLDLTNNIEKLALLQKNNLQESYQKFDNFLISSRYVLSQNTILKNDIEDTQKIANELLKFNGNISKTDLNKQIDNIEIVSEDLLADLTKLTQLKYTAGATLSELDIMSDLRTLSQHIAKNILALKANTKYHPKIVFNLNKDILVFKEDLNLLTHGDKSKKLQGIHDLASENTLKEIQEKFLIISDSVNTILTHINAIASAKNNYQQISKNTADINEIINGILTVKAGFWNLKNILNIVIILLSVSGLVNLIIFIKNYNNDYSNLPIVNLQSMSNLINNLANNNDYYVKQNEELNKEISVGKNNIDSVLEQYKLVADNLKNKNNILLENVVALSSMEDKNNSILNDIEISLKALQDLRLEGSNLIVETEKFTQEVNGINSHSQILNDLSEQISVLMFNIAIQSHNENAESNENFAVVAEDIQHLAEQSSEKTKLISKQISDGQNAIKNLTNLVENMLQQMNLSLQNIEKNKQQLNTLNDEITTLKNQQNKTSTNDDYYNVENCLSSIQSSLQNIIQIYTLSQQNNNNFFSDNKTILALNNIVNQLQNLLNT